MTDRFARHDGIPGWDQALLRAASVVIVGVGALGNEASRLLAMAGVGRLVLCDPDVVEVSNLSRCVLFRDHDVGQPKAEVAASRLRDLAPGLTVDVRVAPLGEGVGLAELRAATLVLSCLDSRGARLHLASRCGLVGRGMVDAGTRPWGGEIAYYPPGGRCYGCGLGASGRAVRDDPYSCSTPVPSMAWAASAPVSALVGAWQAATATRVLCSLPLVGPLISVGLDVAPTPVDLGPVDRTCPLHERIDPATVTPVGATHLSTVAEVLELVSPDEHVFAWTEFLARAGVGVTTLLRDADPSAALCSLGVAPRELLRVRPPGPDAETRYLELAAPPE